MIETKIDCMHAKRVCKEFQKKLGKYHDFYIKNNTLLFVDVSEKFTEMC